MYKYLKRFNLLLILLLLTLTSVFTVGCSIRSGPKDLATKGLINLSTIEGVYDAKAVQNLTRAFDTTAKEGNKFWFSGWLGTKVQKRTIGFYVATGTFDKQKGYILDARIFNEPFRYYRWGNDVYVSEEEKWRKVEPTQVPLQPFADFDKLIPYAKKAVKLPDEKVLSKECDVYKISLNYDEAAKMLNTLGIGIPKGKTVASSVYFKKMKMDLVVNAGKADHFIYQFRTYTSIPLPDAGTMYQEVSMKFFDYNSSTVNLPGPEKIAPYMVKD
jgi:hypothetical protein